MNSALLLVCAALVAQDASFTLSPQQPVAGAALTVTVAAGEEGRLLSMASPFGEWRFTTRVTSAGGSWRVDVPRDMPLLMIGVGAGDELVLPHRAVTVIAEGGMPAKRGYFWRALLTTGFPTPFPVAEVDAAAALELAREAILRDPDYLPARELLWRIQALRATSPEAKTAFLTNLDSELGSAPAGRLVLAATRVHLMLGDAEGARALETRHKVRIAPIVLAEQKRWQEIVGAGAPEVQKTRLHAWLSDDPLSAWTPQCLQILAAAYAGLGDHENTAIFGLASLRMTPEDAMTLNGVAYAMAEGGFMLERGLLLADRAIAILRAPNRLQKPPQLSEARWKQELNGALAASLDTRGWLLTGLQRWREAESAFQEALTLGERDEFLYHYGVMLKGQGRTAEARKILERGHRLGGPMRARISAALDELGR
jgi:tetratricopeptide (TPR) repeat protein